jgi:paired amphipathic helix protein Sin3a
VNEKNSPWINNPVAVELGINDSSWSSTASAPTAQQEQDRDHFYRFLLSSVEKLMDGELEQSTFEDCARVTFGTEAYKLFTLDKVIGALNKQVRQNLKRCRIPVELCDDRSRLWFATGEELFSH